MKESIQTIITSAFILLLILGFTFLLWKVFETKAKCELRWGTYSLQADICFDNKYLINLK